MIIEEIDFENETRKHQQCVASLLIKISQMLMQRAIEHDRSKFSKEEKELYQKYTPFFKGTKYGSKEYREIVEKMKPAVNHHYLVNKHHPEFNDINGFSFQSLNDPIKSMDLIDIIEMLCDWLAAGKRSGQLDFEKNMKKYFIDGQFAQLLRNTSGLDDIENELEKHYFK